MLYPNELVQQVKIIYPTLPQVCAQANSVFTLLMLLGIIGRSVSNSSIKKDFLMLFLKNLYQSNYLLMLGLQKAPQINQVQQQQQNDIQKQLSQQLEQIDQQNTQIVEVIKKEDDNNQGQESISIKNDNENNQQINIPLFFYRPSFQSEEQQSQLSQNAIVRNTLLKKQNSFNLVSKKMNLIFQLNQKQKLSFEEDEFKNIKDSFTCKYISDDKQNLSQFSDSIYSLRNLNSKQKHLSKEISFNDSATYNNRDANVFKKKNETSYKQSLISQDKKPPDENINECLKKLKDIQNNDTSNKIKKLLFKFRLCKRRQKLQDSEMLKQINQQKTQIVEVTKKEDDINEGQEAMSIKNDNENNQQINIPLFCYRPSYQSEEQQSKFSQSAIFKNTLLKKQSSFNLVSKEMNLIFQLNQKQKLFFEEDEFKNIKDSFTCQYISDDKQNLSQFSDSIYSLRNLSSKQKRLSKESQINDSTTFNNRDVNAFKKNNETSYKQCLINQDKKPPDENVNECLKKLKAIQDKETSNKIKTLMFKFRLCKRRQKLQDSEMLSQMHLGMKVELKFTNLDNKLRNSHFTEYYITNPQRLSQQDKSMCLFGSS
ncbi:hypothetical protein ABPG74_004860 [Tetrahymena malaccensis]